MATPTNLFEYYQSIDQRLPSITDRSKIYEQYGLGSAGTYTGTATQNIALLKALQTQAPNISTPTGPAFVPPPASTPTPTPTPLQTSVVGQTSAPQAIPQAVQPTAPTFFTPIPGVAGPGIPRLGAVPPIYRGGAEAIVGPYRGGAEAIPLTQQPQAEPKEKDIFAEPKAPEIDEGTETFINQLMTLPSLEDVVKQVSQSFGLTDVQNKITKIDTDFAEEVADLNSNPWLSQTVRTAKVKRLEARRDAQKESLTDQLKFQQDIIGKAMTVFEKEREFRKDILFKQLDIREKRMEAKRKEFEFAEREERLRETEAERTGRFEEREERLRREFEIKEERLGGKSEERRNEWGAARAYIEANKDTKTPVELEADLRQDSDFLTDSDIKSLIGAVAAVTERKYEDAEIESNVRFYTIPSNLANEKGRIETKNLKTKEEIKGGINRNKNMSKADKERALELLDEIYPDDLNKAIKTVKLNPTKYRIKNGKIFEPLRLRPDRVLYTFK